MSEQEMSADDARYKLALALWELDDAVQSTRKYRLAAGTIRRTYWSSDFRIARWWNWALDTEYTAVGPAPIFWIMVAVTGGGSFGALFTMALL